MIRSNKAITQFMSYETGEVDIDEDDCIDFIYISSNLDFDLNWGCVGTQAVGFHFLDLRDIQFPVGRKYKQPVCDADIFPVLTFKRLHAEQSVL